MSFSPPTSYEDAVTTDDMVDENIPISGGDSAASMCQSSLSHVQSSWFNKEEYNKSRRHRFRKRWSQAFGGHHSVVDADSAEVITERPLARVAASTAWSGASTAPISVRLKHWMKRDNEVGYHGDREKEIYGMESKCCVNNSKGSSAEEVSAGETVGSSAVPDVLTEVGDENQQSLEGVRSARTERLQSMKMRAKVERIRQFKDSQHTKRPFSTKPTEAEKDSKEVQQRLYERLKSLASANITLEKRLEEEMNAKLALQRRASDSPAVLVTRLEEKDVEIGELKKTLEFVRTTNLSLVKKVALLEGANLSLNNVLTSERTQSNARLRSTLALCLANSKTARNYILTLEKDRKLLCKQVEAAEVTQRALLNNLALEKQDKERLVEENREKIKAALAEHEKAREELNKRHQRDINKQLKSEQTWLFARNRALDRVDEVVAENVSLIKELRMVRRELAERKNV